LASKNVDRVTVLLVLVCCKELLASQTCVGEVGLELENARPLVDVCGLLVSQAVGAWLVPVLPLAEWDGGSCSSEDEDG